MKNQAWLPNGTLVKDDELWQDANQAWYRNNLTGELRPATPEEIAMLPNPDIERAKQILAGNPGNINNPEQTELIRILFKLSHHLT